MMKIGSKIPIKPNPKSKFKVYIKTMEGDADDTHYVTIFLKDETQVAKFIESVPKTGFHTDRRSQLEENYPDFFSFVSIDEWPHECNSGFADEFDGFRVTYFDAEGNECEVFNGEENLSSSLHYYKPR